MTYFIAKWDIKEAELFAALADSEEKEFTQHKQACMILLRGGGRPLFGSNEI